MSRRERLMVHLHGRHVADLLRSSDGRVQLAYADRYLGSVPSSGGVLGWSSVLVAVCEFGGSDGIGGWLELGHGAFGEVAAVGGLVFVVCVGEDGADEAHGGGFVRSVAHYPGSAFDFFVDPLQGVGRPDLGPVGFGEVGEGQDLGFGGVHELAGFGEQAGEMVRDLGSRRSEPPRRRAGRRRSGARRRPSAGGIGARVRAGCGRSGLGSAGGRRLAGRGRRRR